MTVTSLTDLVAFLVGASTVRTLQCRVLIVLCIPGLIVCRFCLHCSHSVCLLALEFCLT